MLRFVAIFAAIATSIGCASHVVSDAPSDRHAKLTVIGHPDFPNEEFGVNGVGDPFQFEPRPILYVPKGRRVIWYGCPGFVYTDSGPSVTYRFKAGASYELVCSDVIDGKVFIRHAGDGA